MTKAISVPVKQARARVLSVIRETDRVLRKNFRDGFTSIKPAGLEAQVALGIGLTLEEVQPLVRAYMSTRTDVYLAKGRYAGWRKR